MLHQTENLFPPATENTKKSRNWPTNREFGKSSTAPSPPSSCPLLLGWEAPPPPATRGSPLSALFQTGTALLQYYGLGQLQPVILSSSLVNPVHKRCPLCCRPCIQTTHSTQCIDLVSTEAKFFIYFSLFFFRTLCCLVSSVLVEPVYYVAPTYCNYYYKNNAFMAVRFAFVSADTNAIPADTNAIQRMLGYPHQ